MFFVPLQSGTVLHRSLHVRREAREAYDVDAAIVDLRGRVMMLDPVAAYQLAERMNARRDANRFPERTVHGAEILALGLLDEAMHLLLDAHAARVQPRWRARLEERLRLHLGDTQVARAQRAFVRAFPPAPVMRDGAALESWLASLVDVTPAREIVLEERIAVAITNENPAAERYRELFDDRSLGPEDAAALRLMQGHLTDLPGLPGVPGEATLFETLRAPFRAHPTSLEGQLAFVRDHWGVHLGPAFETLLARLSRTVGMLAEQRAGGPPGPPGPAPVLTRAMLERRRDEPEAYSPDADWMPSVVVVAKNAYVWLEQLARWYERPVGRLDEIPDEALATLAAQGFSGLWLIGLWQRSEASARIKRMRGQEDAVASAYALHDYVIAEDLGGEAAWRALRDRAAAHGIRLAADMVPNHVGIDGRWVVEHPDWFVQVDHPPYPGYAFTGANLSSDDRVEVRIEDGYWENRDAAVVFERLDRQTGERRYLYHGNDGTSMPWNDTAQLDYLKPEVREAVIGVILDVARKFPIIRFDAAMTLAKQHVQRLWYPAPGEGGAIPSRSAYGTMDIDAFEAAMPVEFWREVVDRVARDAPGTLLLAEAFWMMEGYFVRTLGMHRVYNSAFMNMLAREANDDYQALMRNVLAFDAKMLGRFVNFMNNPDEETAIEQFGDGDKAFGVATLMATLPGLPMFGHGQVEGLREKYGMEYRRAKWEEAPNEAMVARHEREIAPLLARRATFAGTERFRLFEVEGPEGVQHDVFAYVNGAHAGPRAFIAFHNRFAEVEGRIVRTVAWREGAEDGERRASLGEAFGLEGGEDRVVRYRDHATGLWHLASSDAWLRDGLSLHLAAYEKIVWLDVAEVRDVEGGLVKLERVLAGRGVPDLVEAQRDVALAPLHRAFAGVLLAEGATPSASRVEVLRTAMQAFMPSGGGSREVEAESASGATMGTPNAPAAREGEAATGREPDADAARREVKAIPPPERTLLDVEALERGWQRVAKCDVPLSAAWMRGWVLLDAMPPAAREDATWRWSRAMADRIPVQPMVEEHDAERREGVDDVKAGDVDGWTFGTALSPDAWAWLWRSQATAERNAPNLGEGDADTDAGVDVETWLRQAACSALERDDALATILGIHEHGGVRWFRQEGWRAWVATHAAYRCVMRDAIATWPEIARAALRLERASGFDWDALCEGGTRGDGDRTRDAATEGETSPSSSLDHETAAPGAERADETAS